MSKYRRIFLVGICLLLLTGCGSTVQPEDINKTTLSVSKEGQIAFYLVESFEKDYYDISELTSMAVEEAAAYNTEVQDDVNIPVAVEKVEMLENGTDVKITYKYSGAEVYADYMKSVLFYGTVSEAITAGYDVTSVSLSSVKDGSLVTEAWLKSEAANQHIMITDQKAEVYCPYKVTHISDGAVFNENGSVDTTQADGQVYILMKK